MHFLSNGVCDGAADAAADDTDLLQTVHLGSLAERADEVGDVVAFLNGVEHFSGAACSLDHDGDGALLTVVACNGDRGTLALLVKTEDEELAGLRMFRNQRSFDLEQADGLCLVQKSFSYYFEHFLLPLIHLIIILFSHYSDTSRILI